MIPLKDENPTRSFPIVNYGLIAVNVLIFLWQLTPRLSCQRKISLGGQLVRQFFRKWR